MDGLEATRRIREDEARNLHRFTLLQSRSKRSLMSAHSTNTLTLHQPHSSHDSGSLFGALNRQGSNITYNTNNQQTKFEANHQLIIG